ncbi:MULTISPECIES: saccharopine dehydrogenase family protein [Halorussus]|uniref:saccharopine dehydrogenase family protein n=1 Tax=Halorussus TaxID=1070314 RepID=UPI0020A14E01|nr:saccharopine dehydrogenase NADP-binding domain-containing protein [Halorussus vallis]USZ77461.1 saccharopine dehydrogenase NADP-binding domain-containing protein [Halorussus vallis]
MPDDLLIYGAYGYTGELITERALDEGLRPVVAGRDAEKVEGLATDLGLDHQVFSLEHPDIVEAEVGDFAAVLNCAGPFSKTARPLYSACLDAETDYLDIAGEIDVLEGIAGRDREAEAQDVTLLPGVGFDVVPTDCLAAHLHGRLEGATRLSLAIDGLGTYSPGTVKSIIEGMGRPGAVREDGRIRTVSAAWKTHQLDFGQGPKPAVTIPWGDVSSAYYTTGIPNIETYATVPEYAAKVMAKTGPLSAVLGLGPVQTGLKKLADAVVSGPSAQERAKSVTRVWGEVVDDAGNQVAARLKTPDTYSLTAETAVACARRVLDGEVGAGFQTPASAFGPDFVLEFESVEREDVSADAAVAASQR